MHRLIRTASHLAPRNSRVHFSALLLLGSLLFSACDIVNPAEPEGAYILFEDPQVLLDESTGFTSPAGIRDVWLYHNGFLQGVYPVQPPLSGQWTTVPYILEPTNSFFIEGGIHESGLGSFHLPYPFWERISFDVDQGVGDTFTVTPIFEYTDESRFNVEVEEDFEDNFVSFLPFGSSLVNADSTFFLRRSDNPFQGNRAGFIPFGPSDRWFEVRSQNVFNLARDKDVYAEITYRNSIEFTVGLIYEDVVTNNIGFEEVLFVRESENWNTVYVHLIGQAREIINLTTTQTNFWLWIKADGEGQDGYIYFDDIRLIQEE